MNFAQWFIKSPFQVFSAENIFECVDHLLMFTRLWQLVPGQFES